MSEARAESRRTLAIALLCLDAGLRFGEVLGLVWDAVAWGDGDARRGRALHIRASRPSGGPLGPTKSGRDRWVGMSLRLRDALAALYREAGSPEPDEFVARGVDLANFRKREWRRMTVRAGLPDLRPKDLRDSFASHLLTAGVQLGYVSTQLGHADVAVTARHYARYVGSGADYIEPPTLARHELPADLLARLRPSKAAFDPRLGPSERAPAH